ncbi:Trophinin [Pteropus alecto]|uniref:Trophinin n=1 Tax=Pteropus alecto TaxID=9402 RepID=L5L581_PTEAL|nr:Trophinin [Pteropus alecto]
MDPPVVNWPKKSKTKKVPIKAITNTITAASPVPSANVITINKSKIPSQALKLPITPQINQASATTEKANTQASSVTTQPTKANRQRETLLRQSKAPNLQLATIQAPLASESANSQALIAPTKPKKASKVKKAADKAIASATEISLALTTTHTATTQGQITNETANTQATAASSQTKKEDKTRRHLLKVQILTILTLSSQRPQMPLRELSGRMRAQQQLSSPENPKARRLPIKA